MMSARRAAMAVVAMGALLCWPARSSGAGDLRDLASRWSFDGTLADGAGAVRDDLRVQGSTPRYVAQLEVPGTSGKAVALGVRAGDAAYLTVPISEDVKLGPSYSIEAWIHPTQIDTWNRLVLHWGGPGQYAYHLAIHSGLASLYHGQADGTYLCAEGGRVEAGRWHHVAGVARRNDAEPAKSALEVYLDGKLVATAPYDGTIRRLEREGLGIGDSAGIPSAQCRFRGYLDDVAVWHRALAPKEVAAHAAERADVLREAELARRSVGIAKRAKVYARLRELGIEQIVFAERAPGRDPSGHYYANFGYSCIDPNHWIHGADGGRLSRLDVRTGELSALVDDPRGAVRDPQVRYDGSRILFSYRRGGTHHYNLYEIGGDGSGLRQVTSGPWDDVEPTYLPDGGIAFCSTRCKRYIGCWLAPSAILFRCDADGRNLRMLSSGAFTENTPAVLPDGRILYTRWEYVNRDAVSFHHLWTMGPDGTGPMAFFGNERPGGVFIDAKPVPGTDCVVFIHSPGHGRNEHLGHVALLSRAHGPNATWAMRQVSRAADCRDPYPLSPDALLVARGNQLVLMDVRGEAEIVHQGGAMVHEPCPLVPRPREQVVAPQVDLEQTTGTLLLTDVYHGRNMAGVEHGAIKKLLVLEDLPKPANFHGGGSQPIGHGVTSTLKRILGTVPVEADGSALFTVPALRSIYFALLDERDRSVKQMRSFVTLQPGGTAGCVGCHEPRTHTTMSGRAQPEALARPPSRIEPIEGVPAVLEFPRDVQPILDRHCTKCHSHEKHKGSVALEGDRGPVFSLSYYTLFLHWQIKDTGGNPGHGSGRQPGNDAPYAAYSSASPLMQKIDSHHNDVQLTPRERTLVRLWIDSGAQYPGTYAAYGTGQVGGCWGVNRPVRVMADAWPSTAPAVDGIRRRCGACHSPEQLPYHVTALVATDHGDMLSWTRPLSRYSRHRIFNLTRPEKSLVLLAPLTRGAGGYAEGDPKPRHVNEDRSRPPKPIVHPVVFADATDPDYQKILVHLQAAKAKLDEIKRFDMPGFRPNEHYVREMQRYGVLPAELPLDAPVDPYATDQAYWSSLWHRPAQP
ncbi:MAG TPA: LamG-like jellyroll fold domain-containing protein [Planctomycetota bacterium]|nr:LamG-like jellyroll fold domain-containing protein [Planctomycetota bacterium]